MIILNHDTTNSDGLKIRSAKVGHKSNSLDGKSHYSQSKNSLKFFTFCVHYVDAFEAVKIFDPK